MWCWPTRPTPTPRPDVRCGRRASGSPARRRATTGLDGWPRAAGADVRSAFDAEQYKQRNVVERCFNRLKQFRDFATRYAKRAAYWRSELILAAAILWLREPLQDKP